MLFPTHLERKKWVVATSPSLKVAPGEGASRAGDRGSRGRLLCHTSAGSMSDSAFNLLSNSQGSALSAKHLLHLHLTVYSYRDGSLLPSNAGCRSVFPQHPLFLSLKSQASKMSSSSLFSADALPSCIVHCSAGNFLSLLQVLAGRLSSCCGHWP